MAIPVDVFGPSMMLEEMDMQCRLATYASEFLREWSGELTPRGYLATFGHVGIVLNSAAVLSAFLFPKHRAKKHPEVAIRCDRLLRFIDPGDIPLIERAVVRNAFAHIDERLDEHLPGLKPETTYSPWMIASGMPPADRLVTKRLDEATLTVWYTGESVKLVDLDAEIRGLHAKIEVASDRLHSGQVKLVLWD